MKKQQRNDPQGGRQAKRQRRREKREKRFQAEQQRKEESKEKQHQAELDQTDDPVVIEPPARNVQHLVRQRWLVQDKSLGYLHSSQKGLIQSCRLGGRDPKHIGPPRRSKRLRQKRDTEQIAQFADMMGGLDIAMEQ